MKREPVMMDEEMEDGSMTLRRFGRKWPWLGLGEMRKEGGRERYSCSMDQSE